MAVLETQMGTIVIEFFPAAAPNHVSNFVTLAESGFYDGTLFHRIIPGFMIQGGDPNTISGDPRTWGTGGPPHSVDAEFNDMPHDRGIVSMARSQDPNSAGSQFFIVHQNSNFLDGQYTVFGRIVTEQSFETLDAIAAAETGAQDRPVDPEPVRIQSIRMADRSTVASLPDEPAPPPMSQQQQPAQDPLAPPASGDQIYDSSRLGITFVAPAGWLLQEPGRSDPDVPDVVAVGPRAAGGTPQIYVFVRDADQSTLEQLVSARTAEIREVLSAEDFATFEQEPTAVAGLPAHAMRVTETITLNNVTAKVSLIETIVYGDGQYYTLSYANIPERFDGMMPHYQRMLETFAVKEGAAQPAPAESIPADSPSSPTPTPPQEQPEPALDESEGGGCLIATAAFGSELEPRIQSMRELRDGTVMSTSSGAAFMSGFNAVYYSFSPAVADLEREHPAFRDAVRAFITPMISSLSILGAAEAGSDLDVIAYGSAVILLNAGLYVAAPSAAVIVAVRRLRRMAP
ncbi:MAG: peptidylprolyl isomerase [Nitrosopumilaceae archaeon]|nr:peptidylprolyl isomerase [Nitrosopumilaceae archaeon]